MSTNPSEETSLLEAVAIVQKQDNKRHDIAAGHKWEIWRGCSIWNAAIVVLTVGVLQLTISTRFFRHLPSCGPCGAATSDNFAAAVVNDDPNVGYPRVREDRPHFPSYRSYGPTPYRVSYDGRSIILNETQRVLFVGGSMHPSRATPFTWNAALDEAVRNGLNMVTVYIFWSAHQPSPESDISWCLYPPHVGTCDKDSAWTLVAAVEEAARRGLFVHMRLGPYVCAEYSYGGLPEWIPLVSWSPDGRVSPMNIRRMNDPWLRAMEFWVRKVVDYLTNHSLWAYQGGPIVLGQIENEIGGEYDTTPPSHLHLVSKNATLQDYADWCGALVQQVAPQVVWTMCNGLTAPNAINTCNGYGIFGSCSTTWLQQRGQSGRIQVDQPALWTESEGGFQDWGQNPRHQSDYFGGRTARDLAADALRWFARGGSHLNYYMWWGAYNRGRTAAAGITNAYAANVMLCPSGQRHEPKFQKFRQLHQLLAQISPILLQHATQLENAQAIQLLTSPHGEWQRSDVKSQRMFAYGDRLHFVENDEDYAVMARLSPTSPDTVFELSAKSSVVLLDGLVQFDSSEIDPATTQYKRSIVPLPGFEKVTTWNEHVGVWVDSSSTMVDVKPLEQTTLFQKSHYFGIDYVWYETSVELSHDLANVTLSIGTEKAQILSLFLQGEFRGQLDNHDHAEGSIQLTRTIGNLPRGSLRLCILSESLGYHNLIGRWGSTTEAKPKGITGEVVLNGLVVAVTKEEEEEGFHQQQSFNLTNGNYTWLSSAGLNTMIKEDGSSSPPSTSSTCRWSFATFATPKYNPLEQALYMEIPDGRGHVWLNNHNLGRFWNITMTPQSPQEEALPTQRYYFFPWDFLETRGDKNSLRMFNSLGADLSTCRLFLTFLEKDASAHIGDDISLIDECL